MRPTKSCILFLDEQTKNVLSSCVLLNRSSRLCGLLTEDSETSGGHLRGQAEKHMAGRVKQKQEAVEGVL